MTGVLGGQEETKMASAATLSETLLPHGVMFDDRKIVLLHRPHHFGPLDRFALGVVWEATPLNIDLLPEGELNRAADDVKALILSLDPGVTLDVRLDMRPIFSVPKWEDAHEGQDDDDIRLMREHIAGGMPHTPGKTGQRGLTECRVTIGYRKPVEAHTRTVRDLMDVWSQLKPYGNAEAEATLNARLQQAFETQLLGFEEEINSIERALTLLDMQPVRLGGQEMIEALNRASSPRATERALYESGAPISGQVELPNLFNDNHVKSREYTGTVYTLERSVAYCWPGILGSARTPEVKIHGLSLGELRVPVSISVTIMIKKQEKKKAALSFKHAAASLHMRGTAGEERPETKKQQAAIGSLIEDMSDGSEQVHDTMVSAVIWNKAGEVPVNRLFEKMSLDMGFHWYREPFIAGTLFCRGLPLGCDPGFPSEFYVRRSRQMITRTLARLVPLWGSFRGGAKQSPTAVYLNQLGEPIFFDLFDHTSPHVVIAGKTGYGKSALLNTYRSQVKHNYLTFILDRFGSYDELARREKAPLLKFSQDNIFSIGLMDGPLDEVHRQDCPHS